MTTKNEFDNSYIEDELKSSRLSIINTRRAEMRKNFDLELQKLNTISKVDRRLKKSGKRPESILSVPKKRTYLDRIRVPKNFTLRNCICKMKLTFYFCLFIIVIIDFFLTLKGAIMLIERFRYRENYPFLVFIDVLLKFFLHGACLLIEGILVL